VNFSASGIVSVSELVVERAQGLYCPAGDFYIDPIAPVDRAVITHAHADHARAGHRSYLCARSGVDLLRARLGDVTLQTLAYGERLRCEGANVSLHPAGHVLGASQVRIEVGGDVCVVSGDFKLQPDPTCTAFEPLSCSLFVTESTFGLPIYRWQSTASIIADIHQWWRDNAAARRCSVLFCYALGKAQRILAELAPNPGPVLVHGAIENINQVYRAAGVPLAPTTLATAVTDKDLLARALVLAPPSAAGTPWMRRFGAHSAAFASGWMRVRGARRQRRVEHGFALSDHADWAGLLTAIRATAAEQVLVTHGRSEALVRYLSENGLMARSFGVDFGGEDMPPSNELLHAVPAPNDAHRE